MDWSSTSSDDLCRLCIDTGHRDAWMEFVRRFRKPIVLTVARVARMWGHAGNSFIDDIAQEAFLRICADQCRLLRNFVGAADNPDALGALVRVVASNVTHDFFRGRSAAKRGGPAVALIAEMPEEKLLSDSWKGARSIEREVQMKEIERLLKDGTDSGISGRDRLIFRLYFVQGLTAAAIAAIPAMQLTTKGVESAVHRISQFLRLRLNSDLSLSPDQGIHPKGTMQHFPMKGAVE